MRDGYPPGVCRHLASRPRMLKSGVFATVLQESAGTFLGDFGLLMLCDPERVLTDAGRVHGRISIPVHSFQAPPSTCSINETARKVVEKGSHRLAISSNAASEQVPFRGWISVM